VRPAEWTKYMCPLVVPPTQTTQPPPVLSPPLTACPHPHPTHRAPVSQTPVRRAEWTKYLSLFFNREVEANSLHYKIRTDYARLSSAIRAALPTARQTVCWTQAPIPAFGINQYAMSFAPYKRQFVLVRAWGVWGCAGEGGEQGLACFVCALAALCCAGHSVLYCDRVAENARIYIGRSRSVAAV
jgi:hypothetical protein